MAESNDEQWWAYESPEVEELVARDCAIREAEALPWVPEWLCVVPPIYLEAES
jgi:hypothetical protein